MEERKLDARESMELISRMIQNTRNRLENHAGRPFLVWGYTTVGIALLNYWFNIAGCHPAWCFTWFLIPIIGCLLILLGCAVTSYCLSPVPLLDHLHFKRLLFICTNHKLSVLTCIKATLQFLVFLNAITLSFS